MSARPPAIPLVRAQRELWRHLWNWTLGALLVVWLTLVAVAWYTGHHEAEEITDGQLESVARLWLSVEPDQTLSTPDPIASSRSRASGVRKSCDRPRDNNLLSATNCSMRCAMRLKSCSIVWI